MHKKSYDYKVVNFNEMGDERGKLVALEGNVQIPFDIARVFYVYGTSDDKPRGCHANRNTEFVIISVSGSCIVTVKNGHSEEHIKLDTPTKGLYLSSMVWKEMHSFSDNSVLLVLCSECYDEEEYIFNLDEYLSMV